MENQVTVAVGGYDPAGIATLVYDPVADQISFVGQSREVANASYGAYDPARRVWFFVEERGQGALVVAQPHGRSDWRRLARASSGGDAPCFVSVHPKGVFAAVANYASGSVSLLKITGGEGELGCAVSVHTDSGSGPDRERQDGPHVHCARFYGGRLYHTDLGTDEVVVHDIDEAAARLSNRRIALRVHDGQGPRHILFHPTLAVAWLLTELGSCVYTLRVAADGLLHTIGKTKTLPQSPRGNLGGHIELDTAAARLYVSNRGDDSITTFKVDSAGELTRLGSISVGSASPRHFVLLEHVGRMLVACEEGGEVVCMPIMSDGRIGAPTCRAEVPKAAFVVALDDHSRL